MIPFEGELPVPALDKYYIPAYDKGGYGDPLRYLLPGLGIGVLFIGISGGGYMKDSFLPTWNMLE